MEKLFLGVIHLSLLGSYIIGVVLVLRLLLRRAPKIFSYLLWAAVFIRLIIPISIDSPISLVPGQLGAVSSAAGQEVSSDTMAQDLDKQNNDSLSQSSAADNQTSGSLANAGQQKFGLLSSIQAIISNRNVLIFLGTAVWLLGLALLAAYNLIQILRLRARLTGAWKLQQDVYVSSQIRTPFVFGLLHPAVYLPNTVQESEQEYIICHERVHMKRHDYAIKSLAFVITCIHWFNPLVWLAYVLLEHDMEMSCDEQVLIQCGNGIKKEYSGSLLAMAVQRESLVGQSPAFGRNDVKQRVSHVLKFQKAKITSVIVLVGICGLVLAMLLTNQKNNYSEPAAYDGASTQADTTAQDADLAYKESEVEALQSELAASQAQAESEAEAEKNNAAASLQEAEEFYNQIHSSEEYIDSVAKFDEAYLSVANFDGSKMDYIDNGFGEILGQKAVVSSTNEYRELFSATGAPVFLFRLSGGECEYDTTEINADNPDTSGDVKVCYTFSDGGKICFLMKQPYGEYGIWLVENILTVDTGTIGGADEATTIIIEGETEAQHGEFNAEQLECE